jgi:hypothetical protein
MAIYANWSAMSEGSRYLAVDLAIRWGGWTGSDWLIPPEAVLEAALGAPDPAVAVSALGIVTVLPPEHWVDTLDGGVSRSVKGVIACRDDVARNAVTVEWSPPLEARLGGHGWEELLADWHRSLGLEPHAQMSTPHRAAKRSREPLTAPTVGRALSMLPGVAPKRVCVTDASALELTPSRVVTSKAPRYPSLEELSASHKSPLLLGDPGASPERPTVLLLPSATKLPDSSELEFACSRS